MDRQKDRQTDREVERYTDDRHTGDRKTDREIDRKANKLIVSQMSPFRFCPSEYDNHIC